MNFEAIRKIGPRHGEEPCEAAESDLSTLLRCPSSGLVAPHCISEVGSSWEDLIFLFLCNLIGTDSLVLSA
jgi:hypothetical protein